MFCFFNKLICTTFLFIYIHTQSNVYGDRIESKLQELLGYLGLMGNNFRSGL